MHCSFGREQSPNGKSTQVPDPEFSSVPEPPDQAAAPVSQPYPARLSRGVQEGDASQAKERTKVRKLRAHISSRDFEIAALKDALDTLATATTPTPADPSTVFPSRHHSLPQPASDSVDLKEFSWLLAPENNPEAVVTTFVRLLRRVDHLDQSVRQHADFLQEIAEYCQKPPEDRRQWERESRKLRNREQLEIIMRTRHLLHKELDRAHKEKEKE